MVIDIRKLTAGGAAVLFFYCVCAGEIRKFDAGEYAYRYWRTYRENLFEARVPKDKAAGKEKLAVFQGFVRKFAPHWEKEYEQIDRKFKLPAGTSLHIACFGMKIKGPRPPHECTSWIITPGVTPNKEMILHKVRDSYSKRLTVKKIAAPGKYSWLGIADRNNFYANMGVNSKGVAVSMNSGSPTRDFNKYGFHTPALGRILLEESATAAEAVKNLEKLIKARAYEHNTVGSIWHIADNKTAYIVEHNAKYFAAHPVTWSVGIRANFWHYPEMIKHSLLSREVRLNQSCREAAVHRVLVNEGFQVNQKISLTDSFRAARDRSAYGNSRAVCSYFTNSSAAFVLDSEFPDVLNTAWIACGPPRHTIFLPIPFVVEELPEALLNGDFCDETFARFNHFGLDRSVWSYEAFEKELKAVHEAALEKAREILKKGGRKADAVKIITDAFNANWKKVEAFKFPEVPKK